MLRQNETPFPELLAIGGNKFMQIGQATFTTTTTEVDVVTNLTYIDHGVANLNVTGVTANDVLSVIPGAASGTFTIERPASGLSGAVVGYMVVGTLDVAAS
jgi:hypothetical protein